MSTIVWLGEIGKQSPPCDVERKVQYQNVRFEYIKAEEAKHAAQNVEKRLQEQFQYCAKCGHYP